MKHRIQFRLWLIHSVVLLSCLLILGLYYWKFELADFTAEWEKLRHSFQIQDDQFITEINKRQSHPEEVREYLYDYAAAHSMRILLYDRQKAASITADSLSEGVFAVTLQDDLYSDQRHRYSFTFTHPVTWEMVRQLQSRSHMLEVSALLFCLSTLFLGIYSRRMAMLPLASLIQVNETLYKEKQKQSAVMAAISHDIKTPLTSIKGYIERLLNGRVRSEDKQMEYFRIIHRKAMDIEQLTQDLSDYIQNESLPALTKRNVNLVTFLESISREYKEELQAFQAEFNYSWNIVGNHLLQVDEQRIRQVFANIIQNSLKHANDHVHVVLRAQVNNEMAVFALEDNGPGVPNEELQKIFEPFYRVDKARSKNRNGSGLGLAICKIVVEKHGGEISAYTSATGGLGIRFKLPLGEASA